MKTKKASSLPDELRKEYDFTKLKKAGRGLYAKAYQQGTNVVLLDADIAHVFQSSEMVNETLRSLLTFAKNSLKRLPVRKGKVHHAVR